MTACQPFTHRPACASTEQFCWPALGFMSVLCRSCNSCLCSFQGCTTCIYHDRLWKHLLYSLYNVPICSVGCLWTRCDNQRTASVHKFKNLSPTSSVLHRIVPCPVVKMSPMVRWQDRKSTASQTYTARYTWPNCVTAIESMVQVSSGQSCDSAMTTVNSTTR